MKYLLSTFLVLLSVQIIAQVTFIIEHLPIDTKENESIYISGNWEKWTGGQEKYKLENNSGKHLITILEQSDELEFKFTKGSWKTVETNEADDGFENRNYTFKSKPDTVLINIEAWTKNKTKPSTCSKNVQILTDDSI